LIPPPPRSTLFPYTTLFRSLVNIPTSRIKALAQYAVTTKAQNIANLTEQRRMATLVSFARQLAITAQDDSLDVLDMLIRDLLARSEEHTSELQSRFDLVCRL